METASQSPSPPPIMFGLRPDDWGGPLEALDQASDVTSFLVAAIGESRQIDLNGESPVTAGLCVILTAIRDTISQSVALLDKQLTTKTDAKPHDHRDLAEIAARSSVPLDGVQRVVDLLNGMTPSPETQERRAAQK